MKELQDILRAYQDSRTRGLKAALATVVKTQGSTYRRAGARLFVREDGSTIGSVSGGCLENDVIEKARKVMQSDRAVTAVFDMTSPDDDLWGYGQGCNGVIHVLLEPLQGLRSSRTLRFIEECIDFRRMGVIASVFRTDGEMSVEVGSRLLSSHGAIEEDIRHPVLVSALIEESEHALNEGSSRSREFRFTEGVVEAFIEIIQPPVSLTLAGAGTDAIPVARLAKELGWQVTVVDHRPAFANRERFPTADRILVSRPEESVNSFASDSLSVAVIMTHNFQHDLALLQNFLSAPLPYVGLLGPKKRCELLLKTLRNRGFNPTREQLSRLYSPLGLDIGAESPEEIALSVIGEIQAVLAHLAGGFLRDKQRPIH